MRAQISLEYLIIALIALALISISIFALTKIRTNADAAYENIKFKSLAEDFFSTLDEICALGNGNSKTVALSLPLLIKSDMRNGIFFLTVSNNKNSVAHETKCEMSINGEFENELTIANEDGKIINK